ncbi:hypothetical protein AB205_0031020 [Aquarana catesbeiana]|uniref:eIF3h C-terminal domain-containing protein n=1 Tax=Aquarana catesbeiana TaxID=8400 RepID=A0A2G9SMB4_AQUCT|nr:hypothetical protein AB205_0031020 [Aquarana catesbeiana]
MQAYQMERPPYSGWSKTHERLEPNSNSPHWFQNRSARTLLRLTHHRNAAIKLEERSVSQEKMYIQRRQQENLQRQSRGEPPLPEEDVSKLFKPPLPPPRMDSLLIAGQINTYIENIKEFTSQNLGKLFMAEALQDQTN